MISINISFLRNFITAAHLTKLCPSPDCSGKTGAQKPDFSCRKTATNGSSFYGLEKSGFLSEDLKRKAGLAPENKARENYPLHSVNPPCSKICDRRIFVMSKDNNK